MKLIKIKIQKNWKLKFNCKVVIYKLIILFNFVYIYKCFLVGWKGFLVSKVVKKIINDIFCLLKDEVKMNFIEFLMFNVFRVFEVVFDDVKVVIIGQDLVFEVGKVIGLVFSL